MTFECNICCEQRKRKVHCNNCNQVICEDCYYSIDLESVETRCPYCRKNIQYCSYSSRDCEPCFLPWCILFFIYAFMIVVFYVNVS